MVFLAIIITQFAEQALVVKDSSSILLDEFVAVPFIFFLQSVGTGARGFLILSLGLLIFGFFDSLKPFGVGFFEMIGGGVGIVTDDIAAALLAGVVLFLLLKLPFGFAKRSNTDKE